MKKNLFIAGMLMAGYSNVMADWNYTTETNNSIYANNMNTWNLLTVAGASKITVKVTGETELYYDRVYIKNEDNTSVVKTLHGVIDETFDVDGNGTYVNFTSDYSVGKSGVTVTVVEKNTTVSMGGLVVNGNANITGTLTVNGSSITGGSDSNDTNATSSFTDLDANGTTTLNDLNVSGTTTLGGSVDINANLDANGTTGLNILNVTGASTLVDLNVSGATTLAAGLTVNGTSGLNILNVSGTTTLGDLNVSGSIIGDLNVSGYLTLDNRTMVAGDCNTSTRGTIMYDDNGSFMGCSDSGWIVFDTNAS